VVEPLTAEEVLQLWERCERLGPGARARVLVARARRGSSLAELDALTVGQSELALLELRNETFGSELVALEACPDCQTFVELTIDAAVLFAMAPPATSPVDGVTVNADGWQLRFRLPTLGDLTALEGELAARREGEEGLAVLERCAGELTDPEGRRVGVRDLPAALQDRVAAAMDDADPVAQLTLPLQCPGCHLAWEGDLNVAAFFWREIAATARRLLGEVHELASRYGWTESHILRLSAVRRHAYLAGRWA
jgi:hypothetical protein